MKVILFSEDLKTIHNKEFIPNVICKIEPIEDFPKGLIRVTGRLARCCSLSNKNKEKFLTIEWMPEPINETDTYGDEIQCPYCGVKDTDSWEASDDDTIECDVCGSVYEYERSVSVSYSSKLIEAHTNVTEL